MSREERIERATARLADEVTALLRAAVKSREQIVASLVKALSIPVECSKGCGYQSNAYGAPSSGECPACGDGWVVRSSPSPSDTPAPPPGKRTGGLLDGRPIREGAALPGRKKKRSRIL